MQTAGPRPPDGIMDLSLSSGASAAFLRGVEGSIEIFLPPGELTQGFANCLLGPLARENS